MIEETRNSIALAVNAGLTSLYWHVGDRIRREILREERAEYGRSIVASLSRQLIQEYGNGFNDKNLHRMVQFVRQDFDVAGDKSRDSIQQTYIQPIFNLDFPKGWFMTFSPEMRYDWNSNH